jgi:putative ABC transport system permease protein
MVSEWFRRVWYLLNRSRFERSLQKEMEAHREMMGEPIRFGNALRLREESSDVWGWNRLDGLYRDLKYGIRRLQREMTFTMAATFTLALGIATSTTAFGVADAELWKPLPYPHPDELVAVYSRGSGEGAMVNLVSGAELQDWREAAVFSDLAAVGSTVRRVLRLDTAESVLVQEVTPNYFATLGRNSIAGATFTVHNTSGTRAAMMTDRAWRRLFGEGPAVIGRALTLDDEPAVLIGIVRADDSLGPDPEIFLAIDENAPAWRDRTKPAVFNAVGRLRPGIDARSARAQLQVIAARSFPPSSGSGTSRIMHVEDLRGYYTGGNWPPLYFFLGASFVLLLLSVVNVATLLLTRASGRIREFALRGALGGTRGALARQLLVEGTLLTAVSAFVGILVAIGAVKFLAAQLPVGFLLRGENIPIDVRVCAFVLVIAGLITAAFVLAPLLPLRRIDPLASLNAGFRTGCTTTEGRVRRALLTAQIALTVLLLSGAGIFLKSFAALTNVPLGFDAANALVVRASLSGSGHSSNDAAVLSYVARLLDGAKAIPGVRLAAVSSSSPLGSGPLVNFTAIGRSNLRAEDRPGAILRTVSPAYFETLGIRILRGREFADLDAAGAPRVAVINETLARTAFGQENPLGRVIELLPARAAWTNRPGPLTVVGVASNVKEVGLNEVEFADIYVPFAQMPAPSVELLVRAGVPAATLRGPLREHVARLDPAVPVTQVTSFEERVATALRGDRFNLFLISGFAGVALLLSIVGIYGAVAYNVQARTREFAVCLALGARPLSLMDAALRDAVRVGVLGGSLGVAWTLALAAVVGDGLYLVAGSHNGLLYNVTTTDPASLAAALSGIVLVAIFAGAIPALRVARVDPVAVLRNE